MKTAYSIFKYYRGSFVLSSLAGLVSGGANILMLAILSRNIADYQAGQDARYTVSVFVLVALGTALSSVVASLLNLYISTRLTNRLQLNMTNQIMGLPLRRQEEVGEARLVATFTQDIRAIASSVLTIPRLFIDSGMTIGGLIYLGLLSPLMLGVLVIFLLFCVITYLIPEKRQIALADKTREVYARMMERFVAMNHGNKELKLHYDRREAMYRDELKTVSQELMETSRRQGILGTIISSWLRLMYFAFIAVLLYVMPEYTKMDVVTLMGYALVVMFIQQPVMALIGSRAIFRNAAVAIRKTRQMGLSLEADFVRDPFSDRDTVRAKIEERPPFTHLSLRGVTHSYYREAEERAFTLGPIDLNIEAGQVIFIVGGNGSGKTTLAKLLTGLYAPESGHIHVNGQPIVEENREMFRQYFSAIFSDFYIFESFLGMKGSNLQECARPYLRSLNLEHKVTIETDGKLSTRDLSTGQRKRLALLTAYLEDRPIYLFDEWAADQDPEFKEIFYYGILADLKAAGKTAIVISHDDRYFEVGDRIIKLADGNLIEDRPTSGN